MNKTEKTKIFDYQFELMLKEIDYLRKRLDSYDDISFKIKGWSITLWSALTVYGIKGKEALIILSAIPVMLTFYILEAIFKKYQRRYISRLQTIELFIDSEKPFENSGLKEVSNNGEFGLFPTNDPIMRRTIKINGDLKLKHENYTKLRTTMFITNVYPLYILLILTSIIISIINQHWL